jgi:hypothetical protein
MPDLELMAAFVEALPKCEQVMLARGPIPNDEHCGCQVCAVLRDDDYATGNNRGGDRQAADWLLNWHGADAMKCMAIYGAAAACVASAAPAGETDVCTAFEVFRAAYSECARTWPVSGFIDAEDEGQAHDECTREAVEAVVAWARGPGRAGAVLAGSPEPGLHECKCQLRPGWCNC